MVLEDASLNVPPFSRVYRHVSSSTFEIFLRWAYATFTGTPSPTKAILTKLSGDQLLRVFNFASQARLIPLADAVATCIFFRARELNTAWYEMGFTHEGFAMYESWSNAIFNINSLFVDLIMHTQSAPGNARPAADDLNILPEELQEIPVKDFDRHREQWAKDPKVAKCFYHCHGKDEPCQDGWTEEALTEVPIKDDKRMIMPA